MFRFNNYDLLSLLTFLSAISLGSWFVGLAWLKSLDGWRNGEKIPAAIYTSTAALLANVIMRFFMSSGDIFREFHAFLFMSSCCLVLTIASLVLLYKGTNPPRGAVAIASYLLFVTSSSQLIGTLGGSDSHYCWGW